MNAAGIECLDARRLLAAYAPDVSFGSDGIVPLATPAIGNDPDVTLIHQDSRGLLVTTATGTNRKPVLRLQRYTLDGKIDATFTPRDVTNPPSLATRPLGDRYGRLMLVTYTGGDKLAVTRYTAAGTLDTAFGKQGTATTPGLPPVSETESPSGSSLYDVEVTDGPDGSVYVTGYRTVYNDTDELRQHFVIKLTAAGRADTDFGSGGVLLASVNSFFGYLSTSEDKEEFSFATDPQGRLVVGQTLEFGKFSFTRFTASGNVDKTYGAKGTFLYDLGEAGSSALAFHAAIDAQGRALLLAESASYGRANLLRLTTAGRLDMTFGEDGYVRSRGYGQGLLVQGDGKIVAQIAAGSVYFLRVNADGSRDTTFGADGLARFTQTENVPEQLNYNFTSTVTRILTQLADGTYLTAVDTRHGDSVQKVAAATPARRGTSGKLYLLGDDNDDDVVLTQTSAGTTRAIFNGRAFKFDKRITAVVADLAGGDNRFDAPVDIPQTVSTAGGDDTITTGDADDTVFTRDGADRITTHGGYDTIHFYGGDKQVDAGSGSGYITGGPSGNSIAPAGRVRVTGGTTDGSPRGGWVVDARGTRVTVSLAGGSARLGIAATQTAEIDVARVVSRVSADISGKRVAFDARRATVNLNIAASVSSTISTGPGNDTIRGGRGEDTIDAGAGNDRVYGNESFDSLIGGDGDDILVGGSADDTLLGNAGNDRLYAGVPNRRAAGVINVLDGGEGTDGYLVENDEDQLSGVERPLRS